MVAAGLARLWTRVSKGPGAGTGNPGTIWDETSICTFDPWQKKFLVLLSLCPGTRAAAKMERIFYFLLFPSVPCSVPSRLSKSHPGLSHDKMSKSHPGPSLGKIMSLSRCTAGTMKNVFGSGTSMVIRKHFSFLSCLLRSSKIVRGKPNILRFLIWTVVTNAIPITFREKKKKSSIKLTVQCSYWSHTAVVLQECWIRGDGGGEIPPTVCWIDVKMVICVHTSSWTEFYF